MGGLGKVFFKKGDYLYLGSAKGFLNTRLQRHLNRKKRNFWHIDYLLENKKASILKIWIINQEVECSTARIFCQDKNTKVIRKKFGSSDCRCISHLFLIQNTEKIEQILKNIGFFIYYSFSQID
ncbi:MAG: GIY-YIG nuclease family protein [Candidatus Caldatribacteriota bacterium]